MSEAVRIAVIGGSGLEDAFAHLDRRVEIATPYGAPSAPIAIGTLGGRVVAFLPRHGAGHSLPPGRIPARANMWALASLGVRSIVSSAAVGSLTASMPPTSLVLPDQLLDRTRARPDTYFDGEPGVDLGPVRHLPLADPFCPVLRAAARTAAEFAADTATVAVIEGPRFSTRAESRALRGAGADLVNMTLCPEVALAAELGMGSVTICLVTDMDSGADEHDEDMATAERVFERFAASLPRVTTAIEQIVARIPVDYAGRDLLGGQARGAVLDRAVRVNS